MPGFDGTGPAGMGPMTGWGQGYCITSRPAYAPRPLYGPVYQPPAHGFGFAGGPGFGRGIANRGIYGYGRGYGRRRGVYPVWGRR